MVKWLQVWTWKPPPRNSVGDLYGPSQGLGSETRTRNERSARGLGRFATAGADSRGTPLILMQTNQLLILLLIAGIEPFAAIALETPKMDLSGRVAGWLQPPISSVTSFRDQMKFQAGPEGFFSPSRKEERRVYLQTLPQAQKTAILMVSAKPWGFAMYCLGAVLAATVPLNSQLPDSGRRR